MALSDKASATPALTSWVQCRWERHGIVLIPMAAAAMACVALCWLSYEWFRFLWQPAQIGGRPILAGALDLRILHNLTQRWFRGEPIYQTLGSATYPPASYPLLWPFVGWGTIRESAIVWAVTATACLAALMRFAVAGSGATSRAERVLVALLPLAMYATGATIGNGQMTIHVIAFTAAAALCLRPDHRRTGAALLAVVFFLGALIKPLVSAPFFWIILFVPGVVWPAAAVAGGYVLLTCFAAAFQSGSVVSLLEAWRARGEAMGATAGESNLHVWMAGLGLGDWMLPASLAALGLLGIWVYSRRHGDLWVLLGVSAIVARFWGYHRWYDDLLLFFPMVALFRVTKMSDLGDRLGTWAGVLFALMVASTLAPGGLYLLRGFWLQVYVVGQVLVWGGALAFLTVVPGAGSFSFAEDRWDGINPPDGI